MWMSPGRGSARCGCPQVEEVPGCGCPQVEEVPGVDVPS